MLNSQQDDIDITTQQFVQLVAFASRGVEWKKRVIEPEKDYH